MYFSLLCNFQKVLEQLKVLLLWSLPNFFAVQNFSTIPLNSTIKTEIHTKVAAVSHPTTGENQ
jgi:hypothetical protein